MQKEEACEDNGVSNCGDSWKKELAAQLIATMQYSTLLPD